MKILIVDDEPAARQKIRRYLGRITDAAGIVEVADGYEAVQAIRKGDADLVFLDIQMPGMTGFQVIETIGPALMPPVIFVTAFEQYAVEAFEVQAVDYLLKPFDEERFEKAFSRAQKRGVQPAANFADLLSAIKNPPAFLDRIMVTAGQKHIFIPCPEILYISSEDKYVNIQTGQRRHLLRASLDSLESKLDPSRFARIHRSHLVNLDWVKELSPRSHGDYRVLLKNGEELVLSRRYRDRVF
ncbi:MAG TPA: LytTR family DNA-binding domain-containing protein [Flavilitoribacter sp.]|nr:LytTR family DNA-binding domain-containing protein [Flavilitoribacter sp.]HMQ89835.1 LytTR family DNA-binding domain-containing protein [Flavilitoribacter sp.]